MRGAAAILLFAVAGFLTLAAIGAAGVVGAKTYSLLARVFGIGYALLPLSLFLLAFITIRSFEKHLGVVQIGSMIVFLLSTLGIVATIVPSRGGLLGHLISDPLVAAVDTIATLVFLIAFTIVSLIIAFDIHLTAVVAARERLRNVKKDDENSMENVPILTLPSDESEGAESEGVAEEALKGARGAPPKEQERTPVMRSFDNQDYARGFPILAATGGSYTPPPLSLLGKNKGKPEVGDVKANMNIIKRTLQNFGIQVEMDEASIGPTVTRYAMKPAEGVRLAKIVTLQSNLELALAASPVRIEAPIPGKSLVGIEVPNISRTTLGLAPMLADPAFSESSNPLMIALGRSITGQPHFSDLARMPHLLVAGATGAGKSVAIHNFIVSLLYRSSPERLRFIMVDPKRVELTMYNSIPHLLTPVITDAKKTILAIKWLAKEMERRYNILEAEAVRDIGSYHENVVAPALERGEDDDTQPPEAMPYIVVIIDELADIMSAYPRELEAGIVRLAQMSRAVGIHLILSTQRPSVKVITGLIKANIPARSAFQVASQIDSRTILDMGGAEKLLGAGDLLFLSGEMSKPMRMQAPFISENEVKRVVAHIARTNKDAPGVGFEFSAPLASDSQSDFAFNENDDEDELYGAAKQAVVEAGKASTSYLQRKLRIGYARAARLMDILEERGVIGPSDGAKPREIIGAGNADELAREPEETEEERV
ncbi:hypothetical protein A3H74_02760 [Candidatus Kaiserbacteria bacterium RIFCSPLOWO2_02_FULL_51_13]|uniref:FtsK domain-containing protein n=1 Tax=Candidatus Kaiserbacteria bacterium RIFCSPLOWO2_01_FULL_50_24 TaxID=1798507 RepID=A0A1F6ER18_9BACT|nr:MAG: hypothetical protein A3A34_00460 [Candidatus Kaiserbacteria bacterium RIFCSPLOWO2_01_FULL_50_24]OGG81687.1 MAG: hypothetical protein A3H74_02760 [Candidatus Kaiserbacteria bacterium RIFCSPLOWO2_02_FULL_51_13]